MRETVRTLIEQLTDRARQYDGRTDWDAGYATGLRHAASQLSAVLAAVPPQENQAVNNLRELAALVRIGCFRNDERVLATRIEYEAAALAAVETPPAPEGEPSADKLRCAHCGAAKELTVRLRETTARLAQLRDPNTERAAVLGGTPQHASAPEGYKCSNCTIDGEACPLCYAAWWKRRHPNVEIVEPAVLGGTPQDGAALIAAERARQVSAEGWTPAHDDTHSEGTLARAACSYASTAYGQALGLPLPTANDAGWPWDWEWWKPSDDPIRNLVKAGALIAAEIDRLQRKSRAVLGGTPQEADARDQTIAGLLQEVSARTSERDQAREVIALLEAHGAVPGGTPPETELVKAVRFVVEHFQCDEAQGFRSRDRQFAIEILAKALEGAVLGGSRQLDDDEKSPREDAPGATISTRPIP